MAQFYSSRKPGRKATAHTKAPALQQQLVVGLDHQGRGVVRGERGVRFVRGALPNEVIDLQPQGKYDAQLLRIHRGADERVDAPCKYYGECGGCDLQHLALPAQRQHKQRVVRELLHKFAGIDAQHWLEPLTDQPLAYRRRLRLATHWDAKRRRFQLGLRAQASKTIVAMDNCVIAVPELNELLEPLRALLPQLKLVSMLGHIELLQTEQRLIVLRLQATPDDADRQALATFANQHGVQVWLHCGAPNNVPTPLSCEKTASEHSTPRYQTLGAELDFQPGDFLQAQATLSEKMVGQALAWLDPQAGEAILELYSGSGNFTIPLALAGAQITAIEGVPSMVQRLQRNAERYAVKVSAFHADLEQNWNTYPWAGQSYRKVLLDPARAGAPHAIREVAKLQPQRIIYVSCAPDTLARDAKVLVESGYQLRQAQIIDMFPQTHHIECLTWFEREA
ncbi:23S rRNA (uracil(1939)-C(5))-methyltransferase RlmD [Pseudidiomarina sp. CB1]|uniref:23S rRNA (uracil(1939)-C(5))-methyltransferase RlmD n=1 Tax=Pseudidiomarina sp. CB1 TaxID=2972484 RepID=UPI002162CD02|nr:23S rRNA (uracil(1939)-C(5))-methyltransferase RlmD [Pseudidiomarina sp. CB1]